ncbi:MAG: DMT family transporter [Rhodobacteraceae bacterium]|nr:DMT family transporter [Paracoccaceae bacterium]
MLLLLALVWGGSFFFAEIALRALSPLSITLHRVVWAVPVLWLVVRFKGYPLPRDPRIWGAYLVMGVLNNAIPFSLIFWGQTHISSGLASILNATTAMIEAVVAGIVLRDEPLTQNKVVGALAALFGVAVIVGPSALFEFSLVDLAQLAVLGATMSYAFAGVWARLALSGQPALVNALGMLVGSSILMVPIVISADGVPELNFSGETWAAVLGLSLMSTAFAYALYFAILARAGAANLLLVTLLIPPVAITLGHLFLGEVINANAWSGFFVIALGFAITDGRLFRIRK